MYDFTKLQFDKTISRVFSNILIAQTSNPLDDILYFVLIEKYTLQN